MDETTLPSLGDCRWYHSMELPTVGVVHGDWDLRGRVDEYIGGVWLDGKTVLDVGTASGFLSFEAEKRGAVVTSFDADRPERWQVVPPNVVDAAYYYGMRHGYRLAHHLLQSRAVPIWGDVCGLAEIATRCDVVIVAQILVHLRDPLAALEQAAHCAEDTVIIAEGVPPESQWPIAAFLGASTSYGWWRLSLPIYRQ